MGIVLDQPPTGSWRRQLARTLLYGRDIDRNAKARARIGFAMLAFAAIYAVIGGRLAMYAIGVDGHGSHRATAQNATSRPDIVDRNGEILATVLRKRSSGASGHIGK
jgi:cell division protein FtsI (penicillin-binding protein 3)